MRESKVEAYFVRCVKQRGGEVRKVKWIGRSHAPDRLALMPGWHFLAELKATGKEARAGQAREHVRLRKAGFKVYVLDATQRIATLFYNFDRGFFPDEIR